MKRRLVYLVSGVYILVSTIALMAFAFGGEELKTKEAFDFTGTWKIAARVDFGVATVNDKEFMSFEDDSASYDLLDAKSTHYQSKYQADATTLELPDLSKSYRYEAYTDNYVRLYESKDVCLEVIRYPNKDLGPQDISGEDILQGKWTLAYRRSDAPYSNQYLLFEQNKLSLYMDGDEKPVLSAGFVWEDTQTLRVDELSMRMHLRPLDEQTIFFVEDGNGYIWELHKRD